MFNEILTGKASLESPPAPMAQVAPAPAPAAAPAPAPKLDLDAMLRSQAEANRLAAIEEHQRRAAERNAMMWKIVIGILLAVGLAIFKIGMRDARRNDAAEAAGYRDYDHYQAEKAAREAGGT